MIFTNKDRSNLDITSLNCEAALENTRDLKAQNHDILHMLKRIDSTLDAICKEIEKTDNRIHIIETTSSYVASDISTIKEGLTELQKPATKPKPPAKPTTTQHKKK